MGLILFLSHEKCKEGQFFYYVLAKLRGVGIYKIWKNNKRDPSFTREMRVSTSNKNLIKPVVLAVLICGGKKGRNWERKEGH